MKNFHISKTGYWLAEDKNVYHFNKDLCISLIGFVQKRKFKEIYDFGCGDGEYLKKFELLGLTCIGIEGNPYVKKFHTNSIVRDLGEPFLLNRWDCVVCVDVAELIPSHYESIFLDNLTNNAKSSIVLTWKSTSRDKNHVNCRDTNYIIENLKKRGFKLNATDTYALKNINKKEIYVFDRIYNINLEKSKDDSW